MSVNKNIFFNYNFRKAVMVSVKMSLLLLLIAVCFSCNDEDATEAAIAKTLVTFDIERFDQEFANVTPNTLSDLKEKYNFLFPNQYPDSLWLARSRDTIQMEVNKEVKEAFSDFSVLTNELEDFFKHLNYYFPEVGIPSRVITITSDVDYEQSVILTDKMLLVSLDTYLGAEHHFYLGIKDYIRQNFRAAHITPDMVTAYGRRMIHNTDTRTFVSNLVYYGKILYLMDKLIPKKADAEKIGYTEEELLWAQENEAQIWRYFIEKELLYSTEQKLLPRFLHPAPFSKFYLELDGESPGRIGQFTGWQIVRSYMENNEVSLQQLLKTDGEIIFKKSKYKPAK